LERTDEGWGREAEKRGPVVHVHGSKRLKEKKFRSVRHQVGEGGTEDEKRVSGTNPPGKEVGKNRRVRKPPDKGTERPTKD